MKYEFLWLKFIFHLKIYIFDAGVYKNLRVVGFLDSEQEINGPCLEGLVMQHLRAWNDYLEEELKQFYWRTQQGLEVNFILYGSSFFYAIEVKNATTILPKDLVGLQAFAEEYPEATLIFLYRGQDRLKKGNILCLPVEAFLLALTPETDDLTRC